MTHYYETVHTVPGDTYPTITAHETFEEAETFANAHGLNEIYSDYDTFRRCTSCKEFFPENELSPADDLCEVCEMFYNERLYYKR